MRSPVGLLRHFLAPRRRKLTVERFDKPMGRWVAVDTTGDVARDELTLTTYNVWFDPFCAEQRYLAIADLLSARAPDVMVFQEVTPTALDIFAAQPWIRDGYVRAAITGGRVGNYGMLLLSRLPVAAATYVRLPSRLNRGFLRAELSINGSCDVVCGVHLESGKASAPLRVRQLDEIFGELRSTETAVLLGDFNMRDAENAQITDPYCDVWPALRPRDAGFTEDTAINHMRYDMKNKGRQVRFDRVLVKGQRWSATDIELLGTQPISVTQPRVFPSDHFGVQCRLKSRNP